MTQSAFSAHTVPSPPGNPNVSTFGGDQTCRTAQASYQVRQLLWKLVVATFLLMAIGSATRVMNAGLACPDWPLCYGTLIPTQQMNLQVFLEWIHRLDASLIGLMSVGLMGLSIWKRRSLPKWLPWAATLALLLVCIQGALGALTVTALLRFDIVTAHLGTALCFFSLLLGMAIALVPPSSPRVTSASSDPTGLDLNPVSDPHSSEFDRVRTKLEARPRTFTGLAWGATIVIYLQSLTGGLVGARWALHQCLAIAQLCTVMNSHLLGILPSAIGVLGLMGWAWKTRESIDPLIAGFLRIAGILLLSQLLLGFSTFRLHLEVELLTIAHQATGAALLGSLLCVSVRSSLLQHESRPFNS